MATDLAQTPEFQQQLGLFYAAWMSNELMLDYAIGQLLRLHHDQTHLLTSGMDSGRKLRLLKNAWKERDDERKDIVVQLLDYFQGETKRNIFAHSFLITSPHAVVFVERSFSHDYHVKEHSFTLLQFRTHVAAFVEKATRFRQVMNIDVGSQDFRAFRAAALSRIRNDSKSQRAAKQPPKSKA